MLPQVVQKYGLKAILVGRGEMTRVTSICCGRLSAGGDEEPSEVERLIEAAKNNRDGHRDDTMILVAFRHGLRANGIFAP
jgi:hypothetical protein